MEGIHEISPLSARELYLIGGRERVSWLSGLFVAPSQRFVEPSVAEMIGRAEHLVQQTHPITVAGPRRFFTGLPTSPTVPAVYTLAEK